LAMFAPSSNTAPAGPATRKRPRASRSCTGRGLNGRTRGPAPLSPYHRFTRSEWAALRADTPLTLSMEDLSRLRSLTIPISLEEVVAIYLPLSRLLALYVRRRKASIRQPSASSAPKAARSPISSASPARSRPANRPFRASCSSFVALAEYAESRTRHHGWISVSERDPRKRRDFGEKGLSGKLRQQQASVLCVRCEGRPAPCASASLFACDLRHCPWREHHHRSPGYPHP